MKSPVVRSTAVTTRCHQWILPGQSSKPYYSSEALYGCLTFDAFLLWSSGLLPRVVVLWVVTNVRYVILPLSSGWN